MKLIKLTLGSLIAGNILGAFINPEYLPAHLSATLNLALVLAVVIGADREEGVRDED